MKKVLFNIIILIASCIVIWLSSFILWFLASYPLAWIIIALLIVMLCAILTKRNLLIGVLLIIFSLVLGWFTLASIKEKFCFNYQLSQEVANEMIDISYLTEEEKRRYPLEAFKHDYQPGQPLIISRGYKATLDCSADFTLAEILKNVFTHNWPVNND